MDDGLQDLLVGWLVARVCRGNEPLGERHSPAKSSLGLGFPSAASALASIRFSRGRRASHCSSALLQFCQNLFMFYCNSVSPPSIARSNSTVLLPCNCRWCISFFYGNILPFLLFCR